MNFNWPNGINRGLLDDKCNGLTRWGPEECQGEDGVLVHWEFGGRPEKWIGKTNCSGTWMFTGKFNAFNYLPTWMRDFPVVRGTFWFAMNNSSENLARLSRLKHRRARTDKTFLFHFIFFSSHAELNIPNFVWRMATCMLADSQSAQSCWPIKKLTFGRYHFVSLHFHSLLIFAQWNIGIMFVSSFHRLERSECSQVFV